MLLSASGLTLGYYSKAILADISFCLASGEVLAVVGHNGSGKSTLIKTILGNMPPLAGQLDWNLKAPISIAHLGQQTEFDSRFPIRVWDLASMGAWPTLGFLGRVDKQCQSRIDAALERAGIAEIADRPLHQLSAGQLQRALFARTIVQDAQLILLDEPFTAVDQATEAELLKLIDDWAAEGRLVVIVVHDLSTVLQHCNKALLLGGGRSLFATPEAILTPENLVQHQYMSTSQAAWMKATYAGRSGDHAV